MLRSFPFLFGSQSTQQASARTRLASVFTFFRSFAAQQLLVYFYIYDIKLQNTLDFTLAAVVVVVDDDSSYTCPRRV